MGTLLSRFLYEFWNCMTMFWKTYHINSLLLFCNILPCPTFCSLMCWRYCILSGKIRSILLDSVQWLVKSYISLNYIWCWFDLCAENLFCLTVFSNCSKVLIPFASCQIDEAGDLWRKEHKRLQSSKRSNSGLKGFIVGSEFCKDGQVRYFRLCKWWR